MYNFENSKITQEVNPWNTRIEKRLSILVNNSSRKKVVYIYEAADTSTFRYRAYNMCQSLSYSNKYEGVFFFEEELDIIFQYLDYASIVIFVRTRWSESVANFFYIVKKRGIPTLFDSDDLVFDLESLPLLMNTLGIDLSRSENYSHWFSYVSRLWLMGSMCDGYIGTNEFLKNRMETIFNKPAFVVNNFLNNEQLEASMEIFNKKKSLTNSEPFTIGYFSGSPSHVNDFKKVASEIKDLMDTYDDIQLSVTGFMEFPSYLKEHIKSGRITYTSLVDFLTLQVKIASVDVNIVPLVVNEFTNCKSELKFFEAAIVGTVTCASPIYSYKDSIQDNKTGFLCMDGEWFVAIENIYKKRISDDMVALANEYCLERYSPNKSAQILEDIFDIILSKILIMRDN
ncbi:MAG: hypothetical protein ACSLEX_02075 [Minisyncoccota bacterium]